MHPSRLKVTSELILGFLQARHVHQHRLATYIEGDFLLSSKTKRVKRFLANQELDESAIAPMVAHFLPQEPWLLALDRTNWQFGAQDINILTLSVAIGGIAVPLFIEFLDKKGNSKTEERMRILQRFLDAFGVEKIEALLADREFIGEDWVSWLHEKQVP